ncbi:MAG: hypothetical protein ACRDZX_17970, partial [Acidimicrobiales bacterium]
MVKASSHALGALAGTLCAVLTGLAGTPQSQGAQAGTWRAVAIFPYSSSELTAADCPSTKVCVATG